MHKYIRCPRTDATEGRGTKGRAEQIGIYLKGRDVLLLRVQNERTSRIRDYL